MVGKTSHMNIQNRFRQSTITLCLSVFLAGACTTLSARDAVAAEIPNRCSFAYATAGFRVADMISAMLTKLDSNEQIQLAQASVNLSRELQCPVAEMVSVIDCMVDIVVNNKGANPDQVDAVKCVVKETGQNFPNLVD